MLTVKERKIILKLDNEGKKQEFIAGIIGCSQATVSKWISRHKSGRTLETLPRSGRPTKLKGSVIKLIREKISKEILSANEEYSSVSTKKIASIIKEEIGRTYSMRHVERILHNLGFSLTTPRPRHTRQDKNAVEKYREEFKKNSNRRTWTMSS